MCGFQATAPYSNLGRTRVLYAVSLTEGLQGSSVLLKSPRVLQDFATVRVMCSLQDRLDLMLTPRYLLVVDTGEGLV